MSFFTPEKMCGFMFVFYCIAYGVRLRFIFQVKKCMDDYQVFMLYNIKRSLYSIGSIPYCFLHIIYYLFLLLFPFAFIVPFARQYPNVQFGFVLLIFYSAEFAIEKLFFLLEQQAKYEALLFCVLHLVNCKAYDTKRTDLEKIEAIKKVIPWRRRYLLEIEQSIKKIDGKKHPWL